MQSNAFDLAADLVPQPLYPVGTGNPPLPVVLASQLTIANYSSGTLYVGIGNQTTSSVPVASGGILQLGAAGVMMDISQIWVHGPVGGNVSWLAI